MTGPAGKGCGGISVNAELLDEYVTGTVLDALESPRVQQAVQAGEDTSAPRRAELLEEIRKARDKRAEARRDWAEDTIEKEDWLDIRQRTEARIAKARREYQKLTGSAAVFGDIPASDMVRDAWEDWDTDRRRAAVKAVMNRVIVSPHAGRKGGPRLSQGLKLQFVRSGRSSTGGSDAARDEEERRGMPLRRSPLVRLRPPASFPGWFRGPGLCARCAAGPQERLITAASSIRPSSPCRTRERRASSAPTCGLLPVPVRSAARDRERRRVPSSCRHP